MARKKKTAAKKTAVRSVSFDAPQSRNEAILQNILGANNVLEAPQSRNEAILQAILNGTSYTEEPQSRIEELLLCILNGTTTDMVPQSRNEEILIAKINGGSYNKAPQSRIEELLIQWLNAAPAYVEKTVTGNPISIVDAIAAEAVALSVAIEPIQEGTGDPSPENIRPITGHDSVSVVRTGTNVWDEEWENGYYDTNGNFVSSANYVCSKNMIRFGDNETLYLVTPVPLTIRLYDENKTFLGSAPSTWRNEPINPTIYQPKARFMHFFNAASGSMTTYNNDIAINYPSTATSYEPYTGISLTIPLGQTVYGGTVDVTTGVLRITHGIVRADAYTWQTPTPNPNPYGKYFYTSNSNVPFKAQPWTLATIDKKKSNALVATITGASTTSENNTFWWNDGRTGFRIIYGNDNTTLDELNAFITDNNVVFWGELQDPVEIPLTPQTLAMLAGTNIIQSAEAANLSLTYKATN